MDASDESPPKINIVVPRWDQRSYWGRCKYFFAVTNPLNLFKTNEELDRAKELIETYKLGKPLPGVTINDVYKAKDLVDSAFHPDTGEKMILFGRMSAQVPMNMLVTGCMITFYKSTYAVIFWQWFNQSFNALVNYTNRSGSESIRSEQLIKSYLSATGGALVTALTLNRIAKKSPPVIGRLVPFAAVAAANCINIPLMRYKELDEGIEVYDENRNELGKSKKAATQAVSTVIISRIAMCAPGMVLTPVLMEVIEKRGLLKKYLWLPAPIQLICCGLLLTFSTPMGCALFPQIYPLAIDELEENIKENASKLNPAPVTVFCNKGL